MDPVLPQPINDYSSTEESNGLSPSQRIDRLNSLASKLQRLAIENIGKRQTIEQRWLEDLRQYNGAYDEKTESQLKAADSSMVFINVTRVKTRSAESHLSSMLFPTDDRNWGIDPIIHSAAKMHAGSQQPVTDPVTGQQTTAGLLAAQSNDIAHLRSNAMADEIDAQLNATDYEQQARKCIHNACVNGTGILKGPFAVVGGRRAWVPAPQQSQASGILGRIKSAFSSLSATKQPTPYVLSTADDPRPHVVSVDPWNFFPDMSATEMTQAKGCFERQYILARDLKKLAKDRRYIGSQILEVMKRGPRASHLTRNPTSEKRAAGYQNYGDTAIQVDEERYEIWEYHGPLESDDLRACGVDIPSEQDFSGEVNEIMGCVVFCSGIVIKAYLNPLETGDIPYSVFNWEKDESSIFGYGVPYRMRNPQKVINAAWRMMLDNAGLSVGPQIVVNKALVQPESDSDYRLKPRKVWALTDRTRNVRDVFAAFEVNSHLPELEQIFNAAKELADEETGISQIEQGEQGQHVTTTFQGMAMLQNNSNMMLTGMMKNWDDGITLTLIRRFVDWNMQNSMRDEIKGDFEVEPRGSTVLLAREMQTQNLMMLGTTIAANPMYAPLMKPIKILRKIAQTMHIEPDDLIKTDDELSKEQQQAQQNPPQQPIELQVKQMEMQFKQQIQAQEQKFEQELETARAQNRQIELQMEREIEVLQQQGADRSKAADLHARATEAVRERAHQRQVQLDNHAVSHARDMTMAHANAALKPPPASAEVNSSTQPDSGPGVTR